MLVVVALLPTISCGTLRVKLYVCADAVYRSEDVDLEAEFEQNKLNSAVYLISMAMQISNFAVNYKVGTWTYRMRGGERGGGGFRGVKTFAGNKGFIHS